MKSANGPPSSGGYAAGGAAPGAPPLATLEELYEEQEGELLVYRSGKVMWRTRDFLFEVQAGTPCSFDQEFVAIRETMETDAITEPSTPLAGGTDRDADDATSKLRKAEKAEATAKTDPPMHLYRLGSMTQRLVVSPDVGSLLQRCAYERASKA